MNPNLNRIPLLRLLVPFIIGIIGTIYLCPKSQFIFISFGIFIFIFLILFLIKNINESYNLRWIFGILIFINMLLSGSALISLKNIKKEKNAKLLTAKNIQLVTGKLIEPIQHKKNSIKTVLKINRIKNNNKWTKINSKVILYLEKDSLSKQLKIADYISFTPKLKPIDSPKNPHEFDFKKYLSYNQVHHQAHIKTIDWILIQNGSTTNVFRIANNCRTFLINKLAAKGINGDELAIASALILGFKDNINGQLKNAFASAGAMHVLAVSGLHVGVIFLICNHLLSFFEKFKYGRILKGLILILSIWGYALITGLSPSVMRAATMFTFIIAAKMTNRKSNLFNTLAASALILLIYNPFLIMEVGFQLSYLAVIGIVIIQPWINNWFSFHLFLPKKMWEIAAVSLAAQIATFPLALLYFHQFPNYFMLSNLIVIPIAIIILYLGIITLIFSGIPLIGDYITVMLKYTIRALNFIVNVIDQLPYALSENIPFNIFDTWLVYILIISVIALIAYRKFKFLLIASICAIIFSISSIFRATKVLNQRQLIIYNIPQYSTINFIDGKDNFLISNEALLGNRNKLMFHVQNNWIKLGLDNQKIISFDSLYSTNQISHKIHSNNLISKKNYFLFYNNKIAIIDYKFRPNERIKKLSIDLLILTKKSGLSIVEILKNFNTKEIVIDASYSLYNSKRIKEELKNKGVNSWSILIDGPFIKNIY